MKVICMLKGLLTCAEFAAACGMRNASTLRRWVSKGEFKPVARIEGRLYFSVEQIEAAKIKHKPQHGRYNRSKNENTASLFDIEEAKSMNENTVGTANVEVADNSTVEDTENCACEARSNDSEGVDVLQVPLPEKAAESEVDGEENQGISFSTRKEGSVGDDTLTEDDDVKAVDTPVDTPADTPDNAVALEKATVEESAVVEAARVDSPVIGIAEYNTLLVWAEKISNGQVDAVTQIKSFVGNHFDSEVDTKEIVGIIEAEGLNGFRRYLTRFDFTVADDAGYMHKLCKLDNGEVVLGDSDFESPVDIPVGDSVSVGEVSNNPVDVPAEDTPQDSKSTSGTPSEVDSESVDTPAADPPAVESSFLEGKDFKAEDPNANDGLDADSKVTGDTADNPNVETGSAFPERITPAEVTVEDPPFIEDIAAPNLDARANRIRQKIKDIYNNAIDVGFELIAAKKEIKHGGWGDWLKKEFDWSDRQARYFMAVAERFGNRNTYSVFNFSTLKALLTLPEEEAERFIEEQNVAGRPVESQSAKMLRQSIKDWKHRNDSPEISGSYINVTGEPENDSIVDSLNNAAKSQQEPCQGDSEGVDDVEYPLPEKAAEGVDDVESVNAESNNPFLSTRKEGSGGDDTLTEDNDVKAADTSGDTPADTSGDTPGNTALGNQSVDTEEPVKKLPPIARNNNGSVEWYTPADIIEAARKVLDTIDLDPASSIVANETVKAEKFFTADDNGLEKEWSGRVFMNPPFTSGLIEKFVEKLVIEYTARNVKAAVVVVDNGTETRWFSRLVEASAAIVFTRGRVNFLNSGTLKAGSPTRGQAFLYFGNDPDKFLAEFSQFGWCCRPVKGMTADAKA